MDFTTQSNHMTTLDPVNLEILLIVGDLKKDPEKDISEAVKPINILVKIQLQ